MGEGEVERDEHRDGGHVAASVGTSGRTSWATVVEAADVGDDGATHHDVVEVSHDEVGVMKVHVDRKCAEDNTGQSTDHEQRQGEDGHHRRGVADVSLVERRDRQKTLMAVGMATKKVQEAEEHAR